MALATNVAGIVVLDNLAFVHVKQESRFSGNKYLVTTGDDHVLFTLKEYNVLSFLCSAKYRIFNILAMDSQKLRVFSLRRQGGFTSADKVVLYVDEQMVSVVREEPTFVKPVFSIKDAYGIPVLRLKGTYSKNHFQLQTTDKKTIGDIERRYKGLLKDIFSNMDNYIISFPVDLDTRYKAAVIGACILIDYKYHES